MAVITMVCLEAAITQRRQELGPMTAPPSQDHESTASANHNRPKNVSQASLLSTSPTCPFFAQPTPIKLFSSAVDCE
ncbi:hypothetical protein MCOR02_007937 [Pyricularia oryzae]|nr:hypothetical protein MCOR02_007937 [Pyricularia oryzae]